MQNPQKLLTTANDYLYKLLRSNNPSANPPDDDVIDAFEFLLRPFIRMKYPQLKPRDFLSLTPETIDANINLLVETPTARLLLEIPAKDVEMNYTTHPWFNTMTFTLLEDNVKNT